MNKFLKARFLALALLVPLTTPVLAAGIPAGAEDSFNRMNSIAFKYSLGTLIKQALGSASGVALPSGQVYVGNGSGVATAVTLSGDVTMSNAGVTAIGAGKVSLADLNAAVLVEATGTLTQANLQACHTGAIALVAAPGAGKLIVVDEVEMFHSYSTAAYTNGGDLTIQYVGSTAITDMDVSLVTNGASQSWWSRPTIYNLDNSTGTAKGGFQVDAKANLGLEVLCAVADFATGNVANVLKWRIRYRVVTLLT